MQYVQPTAPYPPQVPEKRRYGAISALILSFFSGSLYRDVGQRWRGFGFWYLVLLMLLTSVPEAIKAHRGFNAFVKSDLSAMTSTFPTITIANGQASIAEPEPYLWKDPKSGEVILYVDTTGMFDLPEGQKAPLKLSKTQLIMRKNAFETQTYQLSQFPPFTVDKNKLSQWIDTGAHFVGPGLFGLLFIFGVIGHLFQILIYGLFGLIFCSMFNTKIDYGALLRLSAVAITPAVILGTVLELSGVNLPHISWGYFALEMIYLGFAVKANASDQSYPPTGFPVTAYPPGYGVAPGGYPQQPPMPPQMPPPVR